MAFFPLKRRPKKPRFLGVADRRLLRRQTCCTVCEEPMALNQPSSRLAPAASSATASARLVAMASSPTQPR